MMNTKCRVVAVALTICLGAGLVACAKTLPPDQPMSESPSAPNEPETSSVSEENLLEQIDTLWAQLDTTRLPQRDWGHSYAPLRETKETMPVQVLYPDDDTAYMLANSVSNLLYYTGNSLRDFSTPLDEVVDDGIISTVLFRINPLQFNIEHGSAGGRITTEYPNHIISAAVQQFVRDGHSVGQVYDKRDVEEAIRYLFGEQVVDIRHTDVSPYYYLGRAGVYASDDGFGGPWYRYPQIVSYMETDDGYICNVVVGSGLDHDTPPQLSGNTDLTKENFAGLSKDEPEYSYIFTKAEDGHLVLTSLVTVRKGTQLKP